VTASATSSIVLRGEDFSPRVDVERKLRGSSSGELTTCCWCADASLVWWIANSANDTPTIRQSTIDARRSAAASVESTPLD
jgi:hypothetical protein